MTDIFQFRNELLTFTQSTVIVEKVVRPGCTIRVSQPKLDFNKRVDADNSLHSTTLSMKYVHIEEECDDDCCLKMTQGK